MDDDMQKHWESFLNTSPSGDDVYEMMCKKEELQEQGWNYLRSSGKLDREKALGIMIFCPNFGKKAMSYLGHFTKREAVIAIQSGTNYTNEAYRTIGNDSGALMDLVHSTDQEVAEQAMSKLGRSMSTSQLVDLMTNSSLEDKIKTHAWNKVSVRSLSDDDLLHVVRRAPDTYRGSAASVLYGRTNDSGLKEEMRNILADSGNTYLMNDEEKRDHFKRKLGF